MEKYMSQMSLIEKHLRRNNTGPGVTVAKLSKLTGIPKESIYKRVSDLREAHTIYSNYRKVNGERKLYYRIAA
jgi:predicted transcriptional regulator